MPQIFHRSTNLISRVTIFGAVVIIGALGAAAYTLALSPWYTDQNSVHEQPVPFSHRHHAPESWAWIAATSPHLGREVVLSRACRHTDVHDLPFADLDQLLDARAGARELPAQTFRFPGHA